VSYIEEDLVDANKTLKHIIEDSIYFKELSQDKVDACLEQAEDRWTKILSENSSVISQVKDYLEIRKDSSCGFYLNQLLSIIEQVDLRVFSDGSIANEGTRKSL